MAQLAAASDLDPRRWLEQGATSVEYRELVDQLRTVDGWQMKLVTLHADGELRIGAVYAVPPWVGVIVLRDPPSVDDARALLATARPDLRSEFPASPLSATSARRNAAGTDASPMPREMPTPKDVPARFSGASVAKAAVRSMRPEGSTATTSPRV